MPNLDLTDDEHAALVRLVKHALASAKNDSQSRWLHYRDHRLGSHSDQQQDLQRPGISIEQSSPGTGDEAADR